MHVAFGINGVGDLGLPGLLGPAFAKATAEMGRLALTDP